jgi:hypothetical protein
MRNKLNKIKKVINEKLENPRVIKIKSEKFAEPLYFYIGREKDTGNLWQAASITENQWTCAGIIDLEAIDEEKGLYKIIFYDCDKNYDETKGYVIEEIPLSEFLDKLDEYKWKKDYIISELEMAIESLE